MRILVANDCVSDVGGVQTYLDAVIGALEARGHSIAFAYCTDDGSDEARGDSQQWLQRGYLGTPAASIASGTSEIMRGIIAMQVLGLPRGA